MVAFANQATFAHNEGRIIDDSGGDQLDHVRQSIETVSQFSQQRTLNLRKAIDEQRQFFQRNTQRGEVLGVAGGHGDPPVEPLEIINVIQGSAQIITTEAFQDQLADRGMPLDNPLLVNQGMSHPVPKFTRPHSGHRTIHHAQ